VSVTKGGPKNNGSLRFRVTNHWAVRSQQVTGDLDCIG